MPRIPYDEFSMLHENAEEWAIPLPSSPAVGRIDVPVAPGRHMSAVRWGSVAPQLVLLHGGAQNAHTFDTVALALRRPLLAVDLPSHGHSGTAPGGMGDIGGHARDVAALLGALGIAHVPVVGMSLGGLVALALAARTPDAVSKLGLIDVTPTIDAERARPITEFVRGPATFQDLDELVARAVAFNPTRSERSLRRGVLHNAIQQEDGTWRWRHQRETGHAEPLELDSAELWDAIGALEIPVLLVRAMGEGSVVADADEAELLRRQPAARIVHVTGSGHSVQGDQPIELARVIAAFLDG
jgi:pimeloyl-ACP methyl ester carboxylesterase